MPPQKTLWRLARRLTSDSLSADWVSASRDSEFNANQFNSWLCCIPVAPDMDCFVIRGAHNAVQMSWANAVSAIDSMFPIAEPLYVMTSDFSSALCINHVGVACFKQKSPNKALHSTPATRELSVDAASVVPEEPSRLLLASSGGGSE